MIFDESGRNERLRWNHDSCGVAASTVIFGASAKENVPVLWGIVLLRLLVPFEIASPVSIYNLIPQEFRVVRQEEQCQQIDEEQLSQSTQSSLVEEVDTAEKNSAAERADATIKNSTEEKTDTAEKNNIVENVWKTIYFAGAEVCFAWFAVSYGRSLRRFATAVPVTGLDVEKWLAEHKCARKISIRRTKAVDTPLTYGLRKPVILLPKNLDLTEKATIEYVLEHEYTHIRRFDQLYKFIMVLAVCIHWWNPLVWLMLYFFNRDIELSCDERVIRAWWNRRQKGVCNGTTSDGRTETPQ